MIGTDGENESEKSVLAVRHVDEDDIYIYIYIYDVFYGISTFVGYLMKNPFYTSQQFYLNNSV